MWNFNPPIQKLSVCKSKLAPRPRAVWGRQRRSISARAAEDGRQRSGPGRRVLQSISIYHKKRKAAKSARQDMRACPNVLMDVSIVTPKMVAEQRETEMVRRKLQTLSKSLTVDAEPSVSPAYQPSVPSQFQLPLPRVGCHAFAHGTISSFCDVREQPYRIPSPPPLNLGGAAIPFEAPYMAASRAQPSSSDEMGSTSPYEFRLHSHPSFSDENSSSSPSESEITSSTDFDSPAYELSLQELELPGKNVANLLLRNGAAKLKTLQEVSGASIAIEGLSAQVSGTRPQVTGACELLENIFRGTAEIRVGNKAPFVIGPGGKVVRGIEESTETSIVQANGMCRIFGASADVQRAAEQVRSIIDAVVEIPVGDSLSHVVGPRGQTIIKIKADTSTEIHVDKKHSCVRIHGEPENAARAKVLIEDIMKSVVCVDFGNATSIIVGTDGRHISSIEAKSGAAIHSDGSNFKIQGTNEQISAATKALKKLVQIKLPGMIEK